MSPIEASKVTDPEEITKINEINNKEYAKINRKLNYLEKDSKCLLNPILIGEKTLIPNQVKKGKFQSKMAVKIIKNASFSYYLIKIYVNYKYGKIKLKINKENIADSKLLKKIKDKTWDAIVAKNNK